MYILFIYSYELRNTKINSSIKGNNMKPQKNNHNQRSMLTTIKTKLLVLIGILIIISFNIITFITINTTKKVLLPQIQDHIMNEAKHLAEKINFRLQEQCIYLETLARMPRLASTNITDKNKARTLEQISKRASMPACYFCDTKGNLYIADKKIIKVSNKTSYKESLKGKTYISTPYKNALENLTMDISVPIYDANKKILGVLIAEYDGLELSNYIKDTVIAYTGFPYILDKTGTIIAHPKKEFVNRQSNFFKEDEKDAELKELRKAIGQNEKDDDFENLKQSIRKALDTNGTSVFSYSFLDNSFIEVASKIKNTEWTVFVRIPRHELTGKVDKLRTVLITSSVSLLFISLVVLFVIVTSILKALKNNSEL